MKLALWPTVSIDGELEAAEPEFLHTNGAGAYTSSTLALMHTRRQHGLLVAPIDVPFQRHVAVSHIDNVVKFSGRTFRLSTHQFPDVAPTLGYRHLRSFSQDPIPRLNYEILDAELELTLSLVRGRNILIVGYTWFGSEPAKLSARPLLAMRPIDATMEEHGGMMQRVSLRQREVEIQPVSSLPPVTFGHSGVFMGSPDWWRRFEFSEDQRLGFAFREDLWTPGTFELSLEPQRTEYLWAALDDKLAADPAERVEETCAALRSLDPGDEHTIQVRALSVSAEAFRVDQCEHPVVLAGYPWEDVGIRDALIAMPGLYFLEQNYEGAKRVLGTILSFVDNGLLPRAIQEDGRAADSPTVDGTLWLFQVARQLVGGLGHEDGFIAKKLYPVLRGVFERFSSPEQNVVWVGDDGLLANQAEGVGLTWMDSRLEGELVTPRAGFAIELQALWGRACEGMAELARAYGDVELSGQAEHAAELVRAVVKREFWNEETGYCYDVIGLGAPGERVKDSSIRPNAVLALAVDPRCFELWHAERILEVARHRLVTPGGLRSLEPEHPQYLGHFEGMMHAQRAAYHQGAAWLYLLGAYARAALRLKPDDFELQMDLRHLMEEAVERGSILGHVAQITSGDAPHQPGGSPAHAWSVAELLRTLRGDLKL